MPGDTRGNPLDHYTVVEHLAEGGMGAIYLGKRLAAGGVQQSVVLKQLLPAYTQEAEFIELFLREAKLSATLDHPNIIHTIDLVTAGRDYFIVMEYLAGGDLRTLMKRAKRRGQRLSAAAASCIASEILAALAYAHDKRDGRGTPLRLIHRDVSPSNILLSAGGVVKLTDFGIAKAATDQSVFYRVKGKVGYMAPEQARGAPMDHRADLYALGICMYEMLTGERLFVHAGMTTPADEIYAQPVPLVSRKVPGLPSDLDKIVVKALSQTPEARFQTAAQFREALQRCAERYGMQLSAAQLAAHLVDVCGPPERWRSTDSGDDWVAPARAGTEVFDSRQEDEDDDLLDVLPMSRTGELSLDGPAPSVPGMFAGFDQASTIARHRTAVGDPVALGRLRTVELTSMATLATDDARVPVPLPVPAAGDLAHEEDDEEPPGGEITDEQLRELARRTRRPATRREGVRPWMIIVVSVLLGVAVAFAIGLSGPTVGG